MDHSKPYSNYMPITPKTVLYLRTDIYDKPMVAGGAVSHTVGVINGLKALGFSVVCASSLMLEHLKPLGLTQLIELKNPRWLKFLRWKINCLLSNIFFTYTALRLCKKYKPAFIYQRYGPLNATGLLTSFFIRIPLILEYNGSEVWLNKHWRNKKFIAFNWPMRLIEYLNIKCADTVIVVSEVLRQELLARGVQSHKILVNPNGVDTTLFNSAQLQQERLKIRVRHTIENRFVIGFVGTFSVWHGIEVLEYVIKELARKQRPVHFLLIGDGPLAPWLTAELRQAGVTQQYATCTGIVPPATAREYLAACDAFICPTQPNSDGSPFFGSPTKLFEYLSMGKPVIASHLEQVADIVQPALRCDDTSAITHHLGITVDPQDKKGFVKAIEHLMTISEQERTCMGINARNKALQEYQWQQHVEKIIRHNANSARGPYECTT
jgi:glycosyltransferase involved in cell wall biosynthesis